MSLGPNGEEVKKPGATHIRRVRSWTPQPTSDEVEEEERLEAEIEEISILADLDLRQAEELRDDSDRVLRGYISGATALPRSGRQSRRKPKTVGRGRGGRRAENHRLMHGREIISALRH